SDLFVKNVRWRNSRARNWRPPARPPDSYPILATANCLRRLAKPASPSRGWRLRLSTMVKAEAEKQQVPAQEVSQVVEHLFRHERGKIVGILTRIFGVENLTLAEDVVQEALSRALQTWPFYGVPENPAAWIMRASRNLALDVVRRQKVFREKEAEGIRQVEGHGGRARDGERHSG